MNFFQPKKVPCPPAASTATAKVTYTDPCPAGMSECTLCGRRFLEDRIAKHEEICRKTKQKKRKAFDPVKMRTQGTEAENFVKSAGKRVAAQPKKVIFGLLFLFYHTKEVCLVGLVVVFLGV